jgi:polysaccharide transporter, PST family
MFSKLATIRREITPNVHRLIVNTSWLMGDRLFRMALGLFIGVWVARYLGPEQFGLLNYSMAFVALFFPLASLGLEEIVIREITKNPAEKDELLGSAFGLKLVGGCLSLLVSTLIVFLYRSNSSSWIIVSILSGAYIFQSFDVITLWFNAQTQSKYVVLAGSGAFFVTTLLKILLIRYQANLTAFALVSLCESLILMLNLIFLYQRSNQSCLNWKPSLRYAKQLIQKSYPMIFSGMATVLYLKIDQIMLGQMLGDRVVGIYSVAVRISEIWYFIPVAIASSVTPKLISLRQSNIDQYHRKMQSIFNIVVLIAYVISICLSFLAEPLILRLYGAEYSSSVSILIVHIWSSVFVFLVVIRGIFLIAEDLAMVYMQTTILGALTNILLNLVLIPRYEGLGAAIATVFSYAVASYLSCIFYPRLQVVLQMMNRAVSLRWLFTRQF